MTRHTFSAFAAVFALSASLLCAADPAYQSVRAKLDRIENGKVRPGEVITLTSREIGAWVRTEVPQAVPQGVRNPRIELGVDTVTGSALVDFLKIREGRGAATSWPISQLIEGERPLTVAARVVSGAGRCTVYLTRVELSGVTLEGSTLDFLIQNFLLPLYPDVQINQPFEMAYGIDRIDIRPEGVRIRIKK